MRVSCLDGDMSTRALSGYSPIWFPLTCFDGGSFPQEGERREASKRLVVQEETRKAAVKAQYDLDLERKERRKAEEESLGLQDALRDVTAKHKESERARREVLKVLVAKPKTPKPLEPKLLS
jgi:hypothetical protein